ncbi:hypothetical protein PENTCL1PPCAC_3687 [Pristionchus entomophagus]|uniref:CUB domain-containing protein n=1 Tax=Pristionchus entomophagus TaxID=358040 RepID=A0AAV5SFV6_9BILA|nr:hypothetical protein PENTCL1PPCAC_3687 [Pristionchus entomophagus]
MRRLLLLFIVTELAYSSCREGFTLINNECRGKYVTMEIPFNQALNTTIDKCNEILGQPVIIHDEKDEKYWEPFTVYSNPLFPLGLMCNSVTKMWEWVDGSAVDYKPPTYAPALDQDCTTGFCTWLLKTNPTYDWTYGSCSNHNINTFEIYCSIPLRQPIPSSDGCDNFEDDSDDGLCYQVGGIAESWTDAQMICKKLGANLASIHNQQENSFVRRLAVSKGAVNGVYLGATMSGKGQDFGWVDGTDWDFTNFYPGFPMPGIGDCIAMDTTTTAGQWINIDCTEKLPVACVRQGRAIVDPSCSTDPGVEGTIITSPGFPYIASMPCDFFLTADVGKIVELEIILLEANPFYDYLVIHDKFLGGDMIANLTGILSNVTYTSTSNLMRVSWEPNGGVNVKGLAMIFRGV